ncbi:MAG: ABC transporter permease [Lachnospiraceae bacterium]|nr:ABC transporter permease [Lachnospiraceae bacterium]
MKIFSFIFYDIKRLFGHGKTAFLAVFSPIPVIIMFAVFLAPMIVSEKGLAVSGAVLNEDDSEMVKQLMNLTINYEIDRGNLSMYPVKTTEIGKKLVSDGKVAVFLYVPAETYITTMSGEKVTIDFYYAPSHAFEALIFEEGIKSSLSVFGQGIRAVYVAADIAKRHGLSDEDFYRIWNDGVNDLIDIYIHRGRTIGKDGMFLFGGSYHFRYMVALLFTACAFFSSFPIMYLTSLDLSETFKKRSISDKRLFAYFISRIISGAVLIMFAFLIMFPVARLIKQIKFNFALSVLAGVVLLSFTFSSLAVLIGSIFKKGQSALWAGLYFGTVSMVGVTFLSDKTGLPLPVTFFMRISPFRAGVSIFSNAMYTLMTERYVMDMLVLLGAFVVFFIAGFVIYRKRSAL